MRSICLLPLVLILACGDNDKRPDAGNGDGGPGDAPIDAPVPLTCAYTEQADATNDDLFGQQTNVAEATAVEFTGVAKMICGKIDNTHYEAQPQRIDVDSYRFNVPAATTGVVYLVAPGGEALDSLFFEIYGMTTNTSESGQFVGTFAVASADLPAGDYVITVSSYDAAAPAAALDYKLIVQADPPARCAKATSAASYTEALEGASGGGNDVFEVRYGQQQPRRKLTDNAADMVEPTGITVNGTSTFRVTGESSTFTQMPMSWVDSFQDRDTYQVTMGAGVNQLSVRLNWPGTTADFDMLIFPMGLPAEVATGWYTGKMEDEFTTLAVVPGMSYWIWAGLLDGSTGQPVAYDLTICGKTFTPPPTM
jgi:hypothetical protein